METLIASRGVGIDVGKRELVTCIRHLNGATEEPETFANTNTGFKKFAIHLEKYGVDGDVPIILESTGPYHWPAARFLADNGYMAKVVNPLHTRQIARYSIRKRKTDKIDAAQLAFLASQGYGYKFVETKEMAKKKALVRHYWKVRGAAGNLFIHERYLRQHRGITAGAVAPYLLAKCKTIKERVVREWSKHPDIKYLDSIPGVTPFIAACILAELQPLDRFERVEQIIAFAGLDPSVKQTGGKAGHHGSLSKRGSRILRLALYLAAFGSFNRSMRPFYDSYRARGLKHVEALCIISRKILRISIALLRKRRKFDQTFLKLAD